MLGRYNLGEIVPEKPPMGMAMKVGILAGAGIVVWFLTRGLIHRGVGNIVLKNPRRRGGRR